MKLTINNHVTIILFSLVWSSVRSINAWEKVIIDTDAGADDATAILLTLKSEYKGFKVLAITCTYGNIYVNNVVENVLKTLTIANRSDILVYKGAEKPLLNEYKPTNYFGFDGFGDFNFTEKIIAKVDESKHAAVALVDLVKANPGEITLLSIGPLTNVAIAMALDPSFFKNLKKLIILGSSISGVGNILPNVEFNFYQDPESNYIVLNRTNRTSILFPWETSSNSYISLHWRTNVLGRLNSTITNFLNKAERISLLRATSWISSDTMAAASMIWPEFIETSIITNVSPVVDGMARGSVLIDYTNITNKAKNAQIIQKFNVTAFQDTLLKLFS